MVREKTRNVTGSQATTRKQDGTGLFRLVEKGKLTIPLFHGTSTLFLDSIEEFGLGGVNPVKELGLLDVLKDLHALCEQFLDQDEEWQAWKWLYEAAMMDQDTGRLNFRHGPVFLTPSQYTAERYATGNPFGSELLSIIMGLIEKLEKAGRDPFHENPRFGPLFEMRSREKHPIKLEVTDVEVAQLKTETEGDIQKQLGWI